MSDNTHETTASHGPLFLAIIFLLAMFLIGPGLTKKEEPEILAGSLSYAFSHSEFEQAILEADAVYIENITTGKPLFQKNARDIHPLASLAKIMTTYSALTLFPPDATLTVAREDLGSAGDQGLIPGEVWSLRDLVVLMLVSSSNDAAGTIEREALRYLEEGDTLSAYMTRFAKERGFDSLVFHNASGLDLDEAETEPGAFGTAEEMSKLFREVYLAYPDIFNLTKEKNLTLSSSVQTRTFENTNTSLEEMPGVVGSKTGYTNTAGGNLSVIVDIGGAPHVVTVLQSSRSGRFRDVQEIIGLIQKEYAQLESY